MDEIRTLFKPLKKFFSKKDKTLSNFIEETFTSPDRDKFIKKIKDELIDQLEDEKRSFNVKGIELKPSTLRIV